MKILQGPINLNRLEGKVGSVKKVFYIFHDISIANPPEKPCKDAVGVDVFLAKKFKEQKNSKIDFVVEFGLNMLEHYRHTKNKSEFINRPTTSYYARIVNLAITSMDAADKSKPIDDVSSKKYPNVRFHYFDVQEDMFVNIHQFMFYWDFKEMDKLVRNIDHYIFGNEDAIMFLHILFNIFYHDNKKIKSKQVNKMIMERNKETMKPTINIVEKLKSRYKNDKVKNVINELINTDLFALFEELLQLLHKIDKYANEIANYLHKAKNINDVFFKNIAPKVSKCVDEIDQTSENFFRMISDLYYLRKCLDKDEITTIVSYSTTLHSTFFIRILIKHFNFDLTDSVFKRNDKKLESALISDLLFKPNKHGPLFIPDLFREKNCFGKAEPDTETQCIDISNFPPLFN